ncbi:short-chain dehydrogenase (plasmid) [Pseudonocardia sp. EC080610-09]|uniref:SDR family NAD(P)-dependent oxidoreductase n=1 Tax=unclassified Pseudonocardia TaxID=2619320 RepID=UPI000705BEB4|nr:MULTISPECIES: SDR family NAD(P)-dependent oxidoreductase [unclassified Pseudonocardia]ALL79270.1 short-chain dehydrogenase [Pseudonocardia sp. EC080610-09]ALL85240.1 short-chain dehydrogenase [Pseudonocardia sp. EC080619-01]
MIDFGVRGRVLVVTGGASGIGRAVGRLAAAQGMAVAVVDRDAATAGEVAAELPGAYAYGLDVCDPEATASVVDEIERDLGPVQAAVTGAGISLPAPSEDLDPARWSQVIAVNLTGTFLTLTEVGRRLVARGQGGSLVAVGSVNSFGGHVHRAHYTSSKFGVVGLVKTLAIEWGQRGIRVNGIAPGPVDTPLLRGAQSAEQIKDTMLSRIPMGRLASPEDQASAALFLISDAASYVNGVMLPVDGGVTAGYFTQVAAEL